jgi:hypothetical protein
MSPDRAALALIRGTFLSIGIGVALAVIVPLCCMWWS